MKRRVFAVLTVVALISLGVAPLASAAPSSVSAVIPNAVAITVPATFSLGVTVGSQVQTNMSISVVTNCPWALTVKTDGELTKAALVTIPSARLVYQSVLSGGHGTGVSANTQFSAGSATDVVTLGTATGAAGDTVQVQYKLNINADDVVGTYNAVHTYTASAL